MFQFLTRFKISVRIYLLVALIALGSVSILLISVKTLNDALVESYNDRTRSLIDTAAMLLNDYKHRVDTGELSIEEAQKRALLRLQSLRYDGENYFWVNDFNGTMLMHPVKPEMIGTSLLDIEDGEGNKIFARMLQIVKEKGEGAYHYNWPPGKDAKLKISYVRGIKGWNWLVGTGVFADKIQDSVLHAVGQMAAFTSLFLFLALGISIMIGRSITRPINAMADTLEERVGHVVNVVASAAVELQTNSQSMSEMSQQTSQQTAAVSVATEEASTSVQAVASATEELSTSISEINRQVEESSSITAQAVKEVKQTDETISSLSEAAQQIGSIIELIQHIAKQTNLLALNATIEAARAGEAGKGFAVVANEVKSLALQTGRATEEISEKVSTMQTVSADSVTAIRKIGSVIEQINTVTGAIASALQQQDAATQEISRNVQQASAGTGRVSSNITAVKHTAEKSYSAAGKVMDASSQLTTQSGKLRTEMANFIAEIRRL